MSPTPQATAERPGASPTRPSPPDTTRRTVGMTLLAAVLVAALTLVEARWNRLPELPSEFLRYLGLMSQGLTTSPFEEPVSGYWSNAFSLMIESLHMAWLGTIIGAVFSLPMGFLAARNVSPRPVVGAARAVLNAIRAVPELIWAIVIMIPIFGLGPLAGTMALGINSIGTLGKLTSEVIEGIDTGPVEAARASGARQLQILRWGTLPQVMPEVVAFWLYRFEINIRAGAILGVVGAGGIGSLLSSVLGRRLWERAGIMLAVIILVTIAVDLLSAKLRARIIAGPRGDTTSQDEEASTHAGAYV
jgi:phosphonate transport system permease protein